MILWEIDLLLFFWEDEVISLSPMIQSVKQTVLSRKFNMEMILKELGLICIFPIVKEELLV